MRNPILVTIVAGLGWVAADFSLASETINVAEIDTLAWQEAQQELALGEVMPTGEDWDRIIDHPPPPVTGISDEGGVLPGSGSLAWRLATTQYGWSSQMGRLAWQGQGVALKLRSRWYAGQKVVAAGVLGFDYRQQRLKGGDLGLVHGYGLLVGSPGRTRSLNSVSAFTPRSSRLVASLGAPDGQTVRGVAGSFRAGRARILVLSGQIIDRKGQVGTQCLALGGNLDFDSCSLGLLFKRQGHELGASLTGSWSGVGLSLGTEVALWQPGIARPVTGAWLVRLGWTGNSVHRLEALLAGSTAAQGNLLGHRPFILGSWSGHGWALRWVGRWHRVVTLRGLVAGNVFRQPNLPPDQARSHLGEVQVRYRVKTGKWLAVSLRSRRKIAWVRSEIFPWQAPVQELREGKTVLSCQGGWEEDRLAAFFLLRSLESWAGGGRGRRHLFSLNARGSPGGSWVLRGGWALAWGAPEDLVSGLSPLPGYVLPRHWGRWVEETMFGLAWSAGGWGLSVACCRRLPDPAQEGTPLSQAWTEIRYRW